MLVMGAVTASITCPKALVVGPEGVSPFVYGD